MRTLLATSILFLLPAAAAAQGTPISARNWRTHPEVRAVRAIFDSTERLIARGGARKAVRELGTCDESFGSKRTLWSDSAGHAIKFVDEGGTDDHAETNTYYYDSTQHLRFAFLEWRHVNGRIVQHRVYVDSAGRRVWENHRLTRGKGGVSDEPVEERALLYDAAEAFAAPDPCADEGGS